MGAWSKLHPRLITAECNQVVHPWTNSCAINGLELFWRSILGTSVFFAIHYPLEMIASYIKHRRDSSKMSRKELTDILRKFLISTIFFGALESCSSVYLACVLRNLIGRFTKPSVVIIPGTLGGLTIFTQDEKAKLFYATYWSNFAMSFIWNLLAHAGIFRFTLLQKTFLFMSMSSIISGLLMHLGEEASSHRFYWFFNLHSSKGKESETRCYHNGSCLRFSLMNASRHFKTGMFLSFVRIIFKKGPTIKQQPHQFLKNFFQIETLRPSLFLVLYSIIFQCTRCLLHRRNGFSTVSDSLLAGALAGSAYICQPSTTLLNAAIISAVQIISRIGWNKGLLPNLPYCELFYAISNGILFDAVILMPELCPRLSAFVINTATRGRANEISKWARDHVALVQ